MSKNQLTLDTPLQFVKGVGPKLALKVAHFSDRNRTDDHLNFKTGMAPNKETN